MRRGDIYMVDFDPTIGAEIRKTRPALIISCDEANSHLRTVTVIPLSSKVDKVFPFEVFVGKSDSGLELDSKVKVTQMRAVDKSRLSRQVGALNNEIMGAVEKAIRLHLAMD